MYVSENTKKKIKNKKSRIEACAYQYTNPLKKCKEIGNQLNINASTRRYNIVLNSDQLILIEEKYIFREKTILKNK